MWEIVWLDSAISDMVRLRDFIAKENPTAAQKAAKVIGEASERLRETPLIGRPVRDLPEYRDLLTRFGAGGYVLRYRMLEDIIYIIHVRHYREDDFSL